MDVFGVERMISHDPCRWGDRSPQGAVCAGESVKLTLRVEKRVMERGCEAFLLVFDRSAASLTSDMEGASEAPANAPYGPYELPMDPSPDGFSVILDTSGEPRVVFYGFCITVAGERYICTNRSDGAATSGVVFRCDALPGQGVVDGDAGNMMPMDGVPGFQLTIFDPGFQVPSWFAGKTMYQIFPDRFARDHGGIRWDGVRSHEGRGWPIKVHEDWNEAPDWREPYEPVDFYGGTLKGIEEHLDYIAGLGVDVIYLNPICEARSNHRYNTGDYGVIDPILGTWEDFRELSWAAAQRGMRIILDTVLSHTGSSSKYFNLDGSYDSLGAAQSPNSPYRSWYDFDHVSEYAPYRCWWNDPTLPEIVETNPSWQEYMLGRGGVLDGWSQNGASGFRLDVADEIPDEVLEKVREAVKRSDPDNIVIGEVWEDPTSKVSYGMPRTYALGRSLDSVMNYPLREYLIWFALGKTDANHLVTQLKSQRSNYPRPLYDSLMNLLSSHDVERIRSVLALGREFRFDGRQSQVDAVSSITSDMDASAATLQRMLAAFMYALPGVPCLYYGDEKGMQGGRDPFDRASFPWDGSRPDVGSDLVGFYQGLGQMRALSGAFEKGEASFYAYGHDCVIALRMQNAPDLPVDLILCVMNRSFEKRRFAVDLIRESSGVDPRSMRLIRNIEGALECMFSSLASDDDSVCLEDGIAECAIGARRSSVFRWSESHGEDLDAGLGVLCHVTSLPGFKQASTGQGGLIASCQCFIDWLADNGFSYWQVLPLNPTDRFGSPYAGPSVFAGNINLLDESDYAAVGFDESAFDEYVHANGDWLLPYAAFCAIKRSLGGTPWQTWPDPYRDWSPDLMEDPGLRPYIHDALKRQFIFDQAWGEVRDYAHNRGIAIIGDMPFYVSADSADVWANKGYFEIDGDGCISREGGVPPDDFAQEGQKWGVPVYRWGVLAENGYDWWCARFARASSLYDVTRLDHFIGFAGYYSIPKDGDAREGMWCKGPGAALFDQAYKRLGKLPFFAEDLGTVTPQVSALLSRIGLQGMDVIQFSDCDPRHDWEPKDSRIVYTSTHDTQTLLGWVQSRYFGIGDQGCAADAFNPDDAAFARSIADGLLEKARSAARDHVVILPLQDILGLDDASRMNVPGTTSPSNWSWRAPRLPMTD